VFIDEYYATQCVLKHGEFARGVTALLIEKTKKPQWDPATLAEVTDAFVESHFSPSSEHTQLWHPVQDPFSAKL